MPYVLASALQDLDTNALVRSAVTFLVGLILSVAVHEFGHAKVADLLGDRLPRAQGRVTLNPIAHADLWGTVVFPLVFFVAGAMGGGGGMLGWGKPVQIALSSRRYRWGLGWRAADFLISIAGVIMNMAFAVVLSVVFLVGVRLGAGEAFARVVVTFIAMNIGLFFFNLLPCPPLDGGRLVIAALGPRHAVSQFLERYGSYIFIAIILVPGIVGVFMLPAQVLGGAWIGLLVRWAG